MEGPSRSNFSNGNFYLVNTIVGDEIKNNQEVVPTTAFNTRGHSFTALVVLPSSITGHQTENSQMPTLVTHDRAAGTIIASAVMGANEQSKFPNSEAIHHIANSEGMNEDFSPTIVEQTGILNSQNLPRLNHSLPGAISGESDGAMAHIVRSSSRKRSGPDHSEGSQLFINPVVPDTTGRVRGDSGRNVCRRTVDYGQAISSSIPVVPPALSYNHPNERIEDLHSMGQNTTMQGAANAGESGFDATPLRGAYLSLLACHIEVFFLLSPLDQALILLNPPSGRLLSQFSHHLQDFARLPPHGQAWMLAEINRTVAEIYAESAAQTQVRHRSAMEIVEDAQRRRAAVQREFELHLMSLDLTQMSNEQTLAVQEHLGHFSTGLPEETILSRINQQAHPVSHLDPQVTTDPCPICLDEFETGQNVGKLDCNHKYHFQCIKTWLLWKNSCPMCKAPAVRNP